MRAINLDDTHDKHDTHWCRRYCNDNTEEDI